MHVCQPLTSLKMFGADIDILIHMFHFEVFSVTAQAYTFAGFQTSES
jgi:hypothetical protein